MRQLRQPPTFRPPTADDLIDLADYMRPADAEECRIMSCGQSARASVMASAAVSDYMTAAFIGDELCCVFGIRAESLLDRSAIIWMLATYALDRHPLTFLRHSRDGLLRCCSALPWAETLRNAVHQSNSRSIRWLTWLGAEFSRPFSVPDPHGVSPALFLPFTILRSNYVRTD